MIARFDVVNTKLLCTDHAVSKTAFCGLMALIIGAIPEGHLELVVSDEMGMLKEGKREAF